MSTDLFLPFKNDLLSAVWVISLGDPGKPPDAAAAAAALATADLTM